ncbi:FAD:protein FMN transferase [candidate division WOR-3 bacterium]|nr:FAD:protein FMN transferase [candidate division WOR-3 bacterium]
MKWLLVAASGLIFFSGCSQPGYVVDETEMGFGSYIRICARGKTKEETDKAVHRAFAEMQRLDTLWSIFFDKSEVAQLNRLRKMLVSKETRDLIVKGIAMGEETNGAFDITVEPLMRLWGFYDGNYRVPESTDIVETKKHVDYRQIVVDGDSVILGEGVNLDLGGIAVGYAVDRAVAIMESLGLIEGLVDAGGDIRVFGEKVWRIGVQNPRGEGVVRVLKLKNQAVSTSGDYENFFEVNNKRYCHIVNPKTGYPATRWVAVAVVAPSALEADVYSTTLFACGDDGAKIFRKKQVYLPGEMEYTGYAALLFEMQGDSVVVKKVGRINE